MNSQGVKVADLRVIVSHPARQANIYYRPRAAEQLGAQVVFVTGLYYRPNRFPYWLVRFLPREKRAKVEALLEKRRIEGLSPENVTTLLGPLLEMTLRPMGKIRQWFDVHDWLASRWLWTQDNSSDSPTILHVFQNSARRTLAAARKRKMLTVLEVTLPPLPRHAGPSGHESGEVEMLRSELRHADFVLVQSEFSARFVAELDVSPDRILRCHLGVDIDYYRPRTGDREPGPVRVLFLGGTSFRKGVHHLLEAWKGLNLKGVELLIAGNRTGGASQLPDDIANCRYLGRVSDEEYLRLLQQADILVHPSLAEGGCNVIYEALACGLPCIISTNASSAVRNGCEGLVFPVGDVEALKFHLLRLSGDPGLRRQMAVAARKRAESLRWESYLERLGDIYRGLGEYVRDPEAGALRRLQAERF